MNNIQLLPPDELQRRTAPLAALMTQKGIGAALVRSAANIYYLTGRVFCGYVALGADGAIRYFVRRPTTLDGDGITLIRKPEEIPAHLGQINGSLGLELGALTYNDTLRLQHAFGDSTTLADISPLLRQVRAVKTPYEQDKMRRSGVLQSQVYSHIPALYQPGMTDIELQIAIETDLRRHGCLGQFRIAGDDMELFMGNVLTGDNADTPSPYDFAMGGGGIDPSIPVGADGTLIRPGIPVMVDMNGNFTGYMTDMTRCYAPGTPQPETVAALELSRKICRAIADAAIPGTPAAQLYSMARDMACDAGMEKYFMGHRSHAGFVGHGIGIEVNEAPVLAPRSRDIIQAGNAIAVEPKFVIPGIGAVGIENTYIVRAQGPAEQITNAPEELTPLD